MGRITRKAKRCAHDGCNVTLGRANETGLCQPHYNARRRALSDAKPKRHCGCGSVICDDNRTGRCMKCISRPRRKCGCGRPLYVKTKGDRCLNCIKLANRLPEGRRDDYELMASRLKSYPAAFEWIMAGKPIEPRKQRTCKTTAKEVIRKVAIELQTTEKDILGDARFQYLVRARATAAVALRRSGMSLPQIGRRMNRDHSTVFYWVSKFPDYARIDRRLERVAAQVAA